VSRETDQPDTLLRLREAAKILAVSERQVWNLIASGVLERVRIGGSTRVRRSDVERVVRVGATQEEVRGSALGATDGTEGQS
jgi:excisionase family DNA binding protein